MPPSQQYLDLLSLSSMSSSRYAATLVSLSCAHRRPHVQNEMVDDDALVELAQCCARACLVLKTVTVGEDGDDLREPVQKAIRRLEKYVDPAQSPLSSITNNTRTVHYIQFKVDEHVQGANLLPERCSGPAGVSPALWKAELQKTLAVIDVCDHHPGLLWFLTYLSGVWRRRMASCLAHMNSAHSRPSTPLQGWSLHCHTSCRILTWRVEQRI